MGCYGCSARLRPSLQGAGLPRRSAAPRPRGRPRLGLAVRCRENATRHPDQETQPPRWPPWPRPRLAFEPMGAEIRRASRGPGQSPGATIVERLGAPVQAAGRRRRALAYTLAGHGGGGVRAEPGRRGPQSAASVRQARRRRRRRRRSPGRRECAPHAAGPAGGQPGGRERGATAGAKATAPHTPEPRGEGVAEVGEGPGSETGFETGTGA